VEGKLGREIRNGFSAGIEKEGGLEYILRTFILQYEMRAIHMLEENYLNTYRDLLKDFLKNEI